MRYMWYGIAWVLVLSIFVSPAFARTPVLEPELPEGYTSWMKVVERACELAPDKKLATTFWAAPADPQMVLLLMSLNGKRFLQTNMVLVGGVPIGAHNHLFTKEKGWLLYDLSKPEEDDWAIEDMLKELGVSKEEYKKKCGNAS
ncbi:MAG: hypothetical protein Q7R73_01655 [bacterium]|nr:hypothetical protein [bacterium]